MTKTVGEELPIEIQRCRELVSAYSEIGPAGAFGLAMINQAIKEAEVAIMEGDTIQMIRSLKKLQQME